MMCSNYTELNNLESTKNSSFLAHSNGINNRLDSYDNEKAKIISIIEQNKSKQES